MHFWGSSFAELILANRQTTGLLQIAFQGRRTSHRFSVLVVVMSSVVDGRFSGKCICILMIMKESLKVAGYWGFKYVADLLIDDVLEKIFIYLDENDLEKCEAVCLKWRSIIHTRRISKKLFQRKVFAFNATSFHLILILVPDCRFVCQICGNIIQSQRKSTSARWAFTKRFPNFRYTSIHSNFTFTI